MTNENPEIPAEQSPSPQASVEDSPKQNPDDSPSLRETRTRISKKWLIRIVPMMLALVGFSAFFFYDGQIAYPKRGASAAAFAEYRYLKQLDPGELAALELKDPKATLTRLEGKSDLVGADRALSDWLTQLKYIGKLDAANTDFPRTDFRNGVAAGYSLERLKALRTEWESSDGKTKEAPSPLTFWDIPSQWLLGVVCTVISIWVIITFVRGMQRRYSWDFASKTLTIPGGHTLTPADIEEFDKREWHRVYIHLKIKPTHPTVGGRLLEFDLMRYEPLEDWILCMERTVAAGLPVPEVSKLAEPA